jgi:diacylglycerol kinase (ATP)
LPPDGDDSTVLWMQKAKPKYRRVLVLVNPRSGLRWSFDRLRRAIDANWDTDGRELYYQFCQGIEDAECKARRAVDTGADAIFVVGGDGTVNTIGRALIGTSVALGIVPAGSGNGFARHFGIPLSPERAVSALADASEVSIDVGIVNDMPFLVTCSMAWEAALTEAFSRSPVRGIVPYVFAGMQGLIEYTPQDLKVSLDGGDEMVIKRPMIFTVANLSQYGGGAKIAPAADAGDGYLELVVALQQDIALLIANIGRLFDGSLSRLPQVTTHRFQMLTVSRARAAPIQVDGELVQAPREITAHVRPACLKVIVPNRPEDAARDAR